MSELAILAAFILGAFIPTFLLWRTHQENRHLLNVILKREAKAPTVEHGFIAPAVKEAGTSILERRSQPTAIDSMVAEAMRADNEEFNRLHPREEAVN